MLDMIIGASVALLWVLSSGMMYSMGVKDTINRMVIVPLNKEKEEKSDGTNI